MFGIKIRPSDKDNSYIVIEPSTKAEREWYMMTRDGILAMIIHKVYVSPKEDKEHGS